MGAHGRVSERMNGAMMMTVRPEPVVLGAEEVAMLLGEYLSTVEIGRASCRERV